MLKYDYITVNPLKIYKYMLYSIKTRSHSRKYTLCYLSIFFGVNIRNLFKHDLNCDTTFKSQI